MNRPLLLPLLLAAPALCIWAIIELGGSFSPASAEVAGLHSTFFGKMIEPWPWLDLSFLFASSFVLLSFGVGVARFWRGFSTSAVQADLSPKLGLAGALALALRDIFAHRKFKTCGAAHARGGAHLLIMCGFGGLFLTTVLVFLGMVVGPFVGLGLQTPLPLGHWIKVLGNAGAISITIGLVLATARRLDPAQAARSGSNTYQDVLFLAAMTLTVVTGILSEVLRLATVDGLAYSAYFLHLTFILFMILFAPFSKFAHVVYHATALTWAHRYGRPRPAKDRGLPTRRAPGA